MARTVVVAALAAALTFPVGVASADVAPAERSRVTVRIGTTPAFDAPIGRKGGVENPVALCSDYSDPKSEWTLTNTETGWSRTYEWVGSLPGMYFPRVPVGEYLSESSATCRRVTRTRSEVVTVEEKTLEGTVSRAEWDQIRRGMTRVEVADIVGSNGRDPFRWDGRLGVTYDMMPFWRWSLINYRNGRVVEKHWNVGHD